MEQLPRECLRIEDSVAADVPRSVVFDVVRRSSVPSLMARPWRPVGRWLDRATRVFGVTTASVTPEAETKRRGDAVFDFVIVALVRQSHFTDL
jgi:NitT/TauT family transport system permease protein